jgi:hypothetical protein
MNNFGQPGDGSSTVGGDGEAGGFDESWARFTAPEIANKEGKSVVFPSL